MGGASSNSLVGILELCAHRHDFICVSGVINYIVRGCWLSKKSVVGLILTGEKKDVALSISFIS